MTTPTAPAAEAPTWPTAKCNDDGCSADIIWARTNAGKAMPVDAVPVDNGNVLLRPWPGRDEPEAHVVNMPERFDAPRYTSHFVTCPAAASFRRPRRAVRRSV